MYPAATATQSESHRAAAVLIGNVIQAQLAKVIKAPGVEGAVDPEPQAVRAPAATATQSESKPTRVGGNVLMVVSQAQLAKAVVAPGLEGAVGLEPQAVGATCCHRHPVRVCTDIGWAVSLVVCQAQLAITVV